MPIDKYRSSTTEIIQWLKEKIGKDNLGLGDTQTSVLTSLKETHIWNKNKTNLLCGQVKKTGEVKKQTYVSFRLNKKMLLVLQRNAG